MDILETDYMDFSGSLVVLLKHCFGSCLFASRENYGDTFCG